MLTKSRTKKCKRKHTVEINTDNEAPMSKLYVSDHTQSGCLTSVELVEDRTGECPSILEVKRSKRLRRQSKWDILSVDLQNTDAMES